MLENLNDQEIMFKKPNIFIVFLKNIKQFALNNKKIRK